MAFDSNPAKLTAALQEVSEKCINCKLCQKECQFLRHHGKPKEQADDFPAGQPQQALRAYECSLCRLCAAVCPVAINPAELFLAMRRYACRAGELNLDDYGVLLAYERRGTSPRYTWYALPPGCDTVFFPGCALPGTRPARTKETFAYLRRAIPNLGIVLDCCTKPSHDLGRTDYFQAMFGELRDFLTSQGIKQVIVACPNCHRVFTSYAPALQTQMIYEVFVAQGAPATPRVSGTVTVHDPCGVRLAPSVHAAVRQLLQDQGLQIEEMPHHGTTTICCGEGGAVPLWAPELARQWGQTIKEEAGGRRLVTYCAGCYNFLSKLTPASHALDLLLAPEQTMAGTVKVSPSPITYWNRLRLKAWLKKEVPAAVSRERTFQPDAAAQPQRGWLKLAILAVVVALIALVHFSGAAQYLERDRLRQLIQAGGIWGPLIYMLIYTVAPALFLPGLPITIVGGILFGPFWGVVFTITSATLGACVAFLISRYVARDMIARKIRSPRWRQLDAAVERHGWKVVAFTRLIPLFPFNLLNYALGLTRIGFWTYAITTFFTMLPACIAFIVFSSSLLDLVRGRVSWEFFVGLALIVLVSLLPVFYNRYKTRKGLSDPLA